MKTLGKWLLRGMIALLVMLAILVVGLYAIRTWLLPDLTVLQPRIEAKLTETLKQPVRLEGLSAAWNWASLDLKLGQLAIGPVGAPVVQASGAKTTLSAYPLLWGSVQTQNLSLERLTIVATQSGTVEKPQWLLAGIDPAAPSDGAALRWALSQPRIAIAALNLSANDVAAHWIPEKSVTVAFENVLLTNAGRDHTLALRFARDYTDVRLGKGLTFEANFSHGLLGDIAQPKQWTGSATLNVQQAHLARSSAWLLPVLGDTKSKRNPQTQAWLSWAKQAIPQATALAKTTVTFKQGVLAASGTTTVQGLAAPANAAFAPFTWSWAPNVVTRSNTFQISSPKLALSPLATLMANMPLPATASRALAQAQVQGVLSDLTAKFVVDTKGFQSAKVAAQAAQLGLQSFNWDGDKGLVTIPTIQGITGAFTISHTPAVTDTRITLNSTQAKADLPRLLEPSNIDFESLTGSVDVSLKAQAVAVTLNRVRFKNPDLDGELSGLYTVATQRSVDDKTLGVAQFTGAFARADLAQLHRYMPLSLSANARDWLRHTLAKGQATDLRFTVNGDLSRFPFLSDVAQAGERFDLQAHIDRAQLNFNPLVNTEGALVSRSWPLINDVSGELSLRGLSLTLQNMEGALAAPATEAAPIAIRVPQLTIGSLTQPVVVFQVRTDAPAATVLNLVRNTPLSESLGDQLAVLKVAGTVNVDANLILDIGMPDNNQAQGTFKVQNGSVQISPDLPPLEQMNATLAFKQSSLRVEQASAQWLGGSVQASGGIDTKDPSQTLKVQGTAQLAAIKQYSPNAMAQALLQHATGAVDYSLNLNVKPEGLAWQVLADLNDTALQWPGLLDKAAGVPLPFSLTRKPTVRSANVNTGQYAVITQDAWEATLGATVLGPFKGSIERQLDGTQWRMLRGAVALGEQAELNAPEQGLGVHIVTGKVNLDALRKEIEALPWRALPIEASPAKTAAVVSTPLPWMPSVVALQVDDLTVANRRFYNIVGAAVRSGDRGESWNANLVAKGINGYLNWTDLSSTQGLGGGQLVAKLSELSIPASEVKNTSKELLNLSPQQVPSIDLSIDALTIGDKALGALALKANNLVDRSERLGWDIESVSVTLPHATLKGKGAWTQSATTPLGEVKLQLDLTTDSLGDTLDGLGFGKLIAGAAGTVKGDVAWSGSPFNLDLASLSGALQADLSKGQFLKVDPGAGRLVGLFSLQNLPRRLTLDFKDTFGTGFAFDEVKASAVIQNGILKTDDFLMGSSVAKVSAAGEVNLEQETQALVFTVKPEINAGSVSLLYMIINPPLGLATLAAQWLLKEPLSKAFTVEYGISGSWDKPEVKQLKREFR
jgi:uncharacterized protein (TIGR02099 family)